MSSITDRVQKAFNKQKEAAARQRQLEESKKEDQKKVKTSNANDLIASIVDQPLPKSEPAQIIQQHEVGNSNLCNFTDYAGVLHGFNLKLHAYDIWIGNPIYKGNEAYRLLMTAGGRKPIIADKRNNSYFLSCR